MGTFLLCTFGSAVALYALLILLSMVMGDTAWLVAGLLALGAVFALLACVLEKLDRVEQRLARLEQQPQGTETKPENSDPGAPEE